MSKGKCQIVSRMWDSQMFYFYWMFYDHFSARSLLAKLGRHSQMWKCLYVKTTKCSKLNVKSDAICKNPSKCEQIRLSKLLESTLNVQTLLLTLFVTNKIINARLISKR